MYWSKVKNILIILFIFVNIFMAVNLILSYRRVSYISDETVENTVQILKKNNIDISKKLIDKKNNTVQIIEINNVLAQKEDFIIQILGTQHKHLSDEIYSGNNRILELKPYHFMITFNTPLPISKKNAHSEIINKLNTLGIKLTGENEISTFQEQDITRIVINQYINSKRVLEAELNIEIDNTGIRVIKGYYISEMPNKNYINTNMPIRNVTGILIDLLNNSDLTENDTSIINIELLYCLADNDSILNAKLLQLTPCYSISFNSGRSYIYNAQNGEYIKYT